MSSGANRRKQDPDLKLYVNKHVKVQMNAHRVVEGILAGYGQLMNLVITSAVEKLADGAERTLGSMLIRGSAVIWIECLDRI